MTVREFVRILRSRWLIILATVIIAVLGALGYALLGTPKYQASALLFVATVSNDNNTQANDGGLFAEGRVSTYTKLLTGDVLAQQTIDALGLHMSVADLQQKITATAPPDTVLIEIAVLDSSPARARDIANTLADGFVSVAAKLETPDPAFGPNARVVVQQRATAPRVPAPSKKALIVAAGLIAGGVIGIALAIVRDFFDGRVKYPDEIDKATGAGTLGEIPVDPQRSDVPLIYLDGDHPETGDAYRELAIRLRLHASGIVDGTAEDAPRVLLIASPSPGDGRTTTAINLSLALAEAGYHVVIVDGDLRRARVASALNIDGQIGLSTVLAGDAALQDALQQTHEPHLRALTSGVIPPNPTELLGSRATEDVLTALSELFEYVIVDSPPLLVADAAILAGSSQALVMVVRCGQTKRNRLVEAATTLKRAGKPLLGSVLTMKPVKKDKKDKNPSPRRRHRRANKERSTPNGGAPMDPQTTLPGSAMKEP